jgi:uridine kinase
VDGLDVVLVEGIFLFQRRFQRYFDLRLWVECDFETALHRAILRGQEGLAVEGTIEAYHSIYFPAQQLHFDTDDPRSSADLIVVNNSFAPQFPRYGA